jgi:hypothetical protein
MRAEPLTQAVQPHHSRLQLAQPHRHRPQVPLHLLLRFLRFLPLVDEDDRLQPRVLRRAA